MSSIPYNIPDGTTIDILKSLDTCCRLETWSKKPTESPLISLAQSHVQKLISEVRAFGLRIISLKLSELVHCQLDISSNLETMLRRLRVLIFEAVDVLDFSLRHERNGDDGATNAVFASLFILNEHRDDGFSVAVEYSNVKLLRLWDQLAEMSRSCLQGFEAWKAHSECSNPPTISEPGDLIDFEQAQRIANTILENFSPRYIHRYNATVDAPYKVDPSHPPVGGSQGVIQKVVHQTTGESFARKTFRKVYSKSDRDSILKELGVMELCHHRNLITVIDAYEVVEEPHTIHLVIAPWAPLTLHEFLHTPNSSRKKGFPWFGTGEHQSDKHIYGMMRGLADAVGYLHGLSVKHKDIKPENILVYTDEDGAVIAYLADVGVSKVYRQGSKTNYTKSTYTYLSLEQVNHQESSLRSDIWQLGCCFAMLLAVASGGTSAMNQLSISYSSTDENRSCNIATEYASFMRTLNNLCAGGNPAQDGALWVVTRMLDLTPSTRFDIETVRTELKLLP